MSPAEYETALRERGLKELEQYGEALAFASKINAFSNLKYKEDFDVGDRVTCVNTRWGVKIDARITEITETYQRGQEEISVVFGESLPTLFEKFNVLKGVG